MGSSCAKSSNPVQNSQPHQNHQVRNHHSPERAPNTRAAHLHNIMNNEFASHLNIEHVLNINHKYSDFFTIQSI